MNQSNIQYLSDESSETIAAVVPIALWHEIESERETSYLLQSETMKQRILAAKNRQGGLKFGEVCEKLGI
jgi:antitoxin YefM